MIRSLARLTAALLIVASAAAFAIGVALERHSEATEHAAAQPLATSNPTSQVPPTLTTASPASTARDTGHDSAPSTTHPSDRDADHGGDSDADHDAAGTTTTAPNTDAPTATATPGAVAGPDDNDADGGHDQDADGGHEGGNAGGPAAEAAEAAEHSELVFGINLESTPLVVAAVVVSVLLAVAILTLGIPWLAGAIAVVMLAFAALDVREILHQFGASRLELAAVAIVVALLHVLAAVAAAHVARTAHVQPTNTTANST